MGSTVIVAIRHDFNRDIDLSLAKAIDRETNIIDHWPKFFGEDDRIPADFTRSDARKTDLRKNGILVSHYHDNEYKTVLFVNHQMMVGLPTFCDLDFTKIRGEADFIRQIGKAVRDRRYPFSHAKKLFSLNKRAPDSAVSGTAPISLFSINTDNAPSSYVPALKSALQFCMSGIMDSRELGAVTLNSRQQLVTSGGNLEYLTTLAPNASVMLHLHHGSAVPVILPNRHIHLESSIALCGEKSVLSQYADYAQKKVFESMGFDISVQPRKAKRLDSPEP